jgi:5-methylcytosine-specific restriction endonuclease McrA
MLEFFCNRVYLQAHHRKPFAEYPNFRYDVSNGITLCKDCHKEEHEHKF